MGILARIRHSILLLPSPPLCTNMDRSLLPQQGSFPTFSPSFSSHKPSTDAPSLPRSSQPKPALSHLARVYSQRVAFFALRLTLGTISSFVEAVFYRSVSLHLSTHIGRYVLWSLLFSAAFYGASTSFLPSSFALYGVMLGSAASLAPVDGGYKRIGQSLLGFAVAAVIGWPFAALLAVPMVLEQLFLRGTSEVVAKGNSAAWAANRARNLFVAGVVGASLLVRFVLFRRSLRNRS